MNRILFFLCVCGLFADDGPPDWLVLSSDSSINQGIEAIDAFVQDTVVSQPQTSEPEANEPEVSAPLAEPEVFSSRLELKNAARAAAKVGKRERVLSLTDAILELEPSNREFLLLSAQTRNASRQWDKALLASDILLQNHPDARDAHYQRAISLTGLKRFDEAIAAYDKALASGADSSWIYYDKGVLLRKLRRNDEAIAALSKAVELRSNHIWANLELANLYFARKDYVRAAPLFEKVVGLKPNAPDAATRLKVCQQKLAN